MGLVAREGLYYFLLLQLYFESHLHIPFASICCLPNNLNMHDETFAESSACHKHLPVATKIGNIQLVIYAVISEQKLKSASQ